MNTQDQRLIERGFPCHHVGAETQRERDTGQAPPINRLHVWWARRPLTPCRAAIVASLADADTDPATFVRQLGIERVQALVQGEPWTLDAGLIACVECEANGAEVLAVDAIVLRALQREDERRAKNRELIARMIEKDSTLARGVQAAGRRGRFLTCQHVAVSDKVGASGWPQGDGSVPR